MTKYIIRISLVSILLMTAFIVITPHVSAIYVWSGDIRLTTDTGWDETPSAMQAQDGKIWVAWANKGTSVNAQHDLYYRIFDGSTWSSVLNLVKNNYEDESPSICQLANGTIYVAWASNRVTQGGYFDIFYKKTSDNGASWSPDTQLTTDPDTDTSPAIKQTANGTIWVAWTSYRTDNEDIFYKTYSGTWSNASQLTTSVYNDRNPSIMQAKNGTIFVFWSSDGRNSSFRDEIYYKNYSYNGTSWLWSSDTRLLATSKSNRGPSIMQTQGGKIWVAYYASVNLAPLDYELYYRSYDGSYWSSPIRITYNSFQDYTPSIFQAQNSTIWFFWSSYRASPYDNYEIYYKTAQAEHDVAITGITPSQNPVFQGFGTKVQVTVRNYGLNTETFDVTLKHDDTTIIGTQTVTNLDQGTVRTITFSWDNTTIPYGAHTLSANASIVAGEEDIDNSFSGTSVTVTIPGDVNGDRIVDLGDYGLVSAHWYPGPPIGPLDYSPQADINYDGSVNIVDVAMVNANWGKSW